MTRGAEGALDRSFGTQGVARTYFKFPNATARGAHLSALSVAVDSRGRITAAGPHVLARYRPNGSLNRSFSEDGRATTGLRASSVTIDKQNRIIIAGCRTLFGQGFMLARYEPNGTLDHSFGRNGIVRTDFGLDDPDNIQCASSVAVDSRGRIVAAGGAGTPVCDPGGSCTYFFDFALARYKPNGSLDDSFDGDGKLMTDRGGLAYANAVAIDGDARIVAAGTSQTTVSGGYADEMVLARLNPNGTFDASFGSDGIVTTHFPRGEAFGDWSSVAIDVRGRIVAAGSTYGCGKHGCHTGSDFALARYRPDGSLDSSFDGDGRVTTDLTGSGFARDVAIDSQGRVVAVGVSGTASDSGEDFAVARYRPNGSSDASFSRDGKVSGPRGNAWAAAIATKDRIVAAGRSAGRFALARYLGEAPATLKISGPAKIRTRHHRASAQFSFDSNEPVDFKCRVDRRRFHSCHSPYKTPRLRIGRHRLKVRAIDRAGTRTTKTKRFEIIRRR